MEFRLLQGAHGREFLRKYQRRVNTTYKNNPNLKFLTESDDLIIGSNSFIVVLANELLVQEGLRTATQADLEEVLRIEALNLRGGYEDTGLVLRSEDEPNSYLARDLSRQLRERNLRLKYPVLFNLKDLTLRVDSDSNYGLAFNLRERANPIHASVLNQEGHFSYVDIDESTGLPRQTGRNGNRTLYTRDFGLSRLCLYRGLDLYSEDGNLAGSGSGGLVVVVRDFSN